MKRIITFGEIMMRLNPEGYRRFVQADRFEASYAGGEANVAVSLSQLGMDAAFVSKVPAHEIGQCAINALRRYGVDTRGCARALAAARSPSRCAAPAPQATTTGPPCSIPEAKPSSLPPTICTLSTASAAAIPSAAR